MPGTSHGWAGRSRLHTRVHAHSHPYTCAHVAFPCTESSSRHSSCQVRKAGALLPAACSSCCISPYALGTDSEMGPWQLVSRSIALESSALCSRAPNSSAADNAGATEHGGRILPAGILTPLFFFLISIQKRHACNALSCLSCEPSPMVSESW